MRIGSGSTPDTLAGKDYDGVFALKHNLGGTPTVTLENSSGGGTSRIKQMPGGYIDMYAKEDLTITTEGFIEVTDGEHLKATIEKYVDVTAKEDIAIFLCRFYGRCGQCSHQGQPKRLAVGRDCCQGQRPGRYFGGAVQVTSDAPLTYIKGALIIAGSVSIQGGSGSVSISAANINLTGQVNVVGDINI